MVVSAPNSAARKRSRPSSSAARDSRVPDGVPEAAQVTATAAGNGNGAASNGRAAKAREELAAVPAQDPSAKAASGGGLDGDADLDGDLDVAVDVDLEDLEDLDDEALAADLEIVDTPDDRTGGSRPARGR